MVEIEHVLRVLGYFGLALSFDVDAQGQNSEPGRSRSIQTKKSPSVRPIRTGLSHPSIGFSISLAESFGSCPSVNSNDICLAIFK